MHSRIIGIILFLITTATCADTLPTATHNAAEVAAMLEEVENLRLQGHYADGIELVKKAQSLASKLENPELEVDAIYQLSLLYYFQHDYPQARAEMKMGLARARVHELENLVADFLAAEGVLEWKQGNLHLALPKLQEAMRIGEDRGDLVSMASISNNIGIIYYTLKNYEEAEFYYRKGLQFLESSDNERLRSSLYSNLAEILIPMDRLDEAEDFLMKALALEEKSDEPRSLAYTYFNLGELASQREKPDKAIDFFERALKLQIAVDDKWAIALTRLRMAQEHLAGGEVDAALDEMISGYDFAQQLNALQLMRDYSAQFIEIYQQLGETGRVQFFQDQHDWLVKRVSLKQQPEQLNEDPAPVTAGIQHVPPDKMSTIETVIIILLGLLILILILENSRLRSKIR